jgi:hypothetical protein
LIRGSPVPARFWPGRQLVDRRHLNAGQCAILVALAYPEPTPGRRNDLLKVSTGANAIDKGDLSRARAIVKWCPEYVEDILAGAS